MKLSWSKVLGVLGAVFIAALAANAQVPGVNSTLNSVFTLAYDNSTMKPTYSAGRSGIVAAASPTDICVLQGSSSKTLKIRRVMFGGLSTGVVAEPVLLVKRTTANVGGTSTLADVTAYDTASAASAATLRVYTANSVLGTPVAEFADPLIVFGTIAAPVAPTYLVYGDLGQPIVLRGTSQYLAVNLGGFAPSSGTISCWFEWTEDSDS